MHKNLSFVTAALVVAAGGVLAVPSTAGAAQVFGVTTNNTLFAFDSATPGTITTARAMSGFASSNENIVGIDFRPATGQLYAIGSFGQLYTVNTTNGTLSTVGAGVGAIDGTAFGFDFNPTIDRIRLTSTTNKNYVVNPDTGSLQLSATDLFYPPGDPNAGVDPNVVGSAYTNNFAGATSSQLYAIDAGLDILATQANNTGVLSTVGPLLTVDTRDLVGFDIFSPVPGQAANTAFASLTPAGGSVSNFYTINLATGAATLVGQINGGTLVTDIAVVPVPEPTAAAALGLAGAATLARRRRR
ncbi:MAG TPA: DUF4394 domain-containing protein [Tepidisphaeraceae bacterium]|nr:DUF4394 domain-containing protein [Tepidisphaeraceae bacterium]